MADEKPNETPGETLDETPAPVPAKKKSSAAIVGDDTGRTIRKLQEQVSKLEDLLGEEKTQREELQTKIAGLGKIPSKIPGKSLLQELDEFIWGKKGE